MDGDGKLTLRNVDVRGGLVELRGAASVAANRQRAKSDVNAVWIDPCAGVADGCDKPAPVGIAAGPGCLDQRRVGDSLGYRERIGVGCRPSMCSSTT